MVLLILQDKYDNCKGVPIFRLIDYWGLTTRQPLWVILCHFPEKERKEIEELVEEMKQRDREERGMGMKVKKQKK